MFTIFKYQKDTYFEYINDKEFAYKLNSEKECEKIFYSIKENLTSDGFMIDSVKIQVDGYRDNSVLITRTLYIEGKELPLIDGFIKID